MKKRDEMSNLQGLSVEQLTAEALRLKEAIFRQKFRAALGDVSAGQAAKRDRKSLARVQTLISAKGQA